MVCHIKQRGIDGHAITTMNGIRYMDNISTGFNESNDPSIYDLTESLSTSPGGTRYIPGPVGRCGVPPHTLTLFKTNIADFPTLFKTEFRFLIPCLRHLTRNQVNIN